MKNGEAIDGLNKAEQKRLRSATNYNRKVKERE